jgi:Domain of unknown function (DUF4224)
MRGTIVECEDICAVTGYERPAEAARCLRDQGIKVFNGRNGRPWTTVGLIEAAGGLLPGRTGSEPYKPEDFF